MVHPRLLCLMFVIAACTRTGGEPAEEPSGVTAGKGTPPSKRGDGNAAGGVELPRDDREAVRKAVIAAGGRDLGDDICAEWPKTFPRVVVVGSFADDAGCMSDGMFISGKWRLPRDPQNVPAGLATAGWEDADAARREALANAWIREVSNAFEGSFVTQSTTAFSFDDTPAFQAPASTSTDDGGVVVSGWIREPSGMGYEQAYHFVEHHFSEDGSMATTVSRRFNVDGERIQAAEGARKDEEPPG